MLGNTFHRYIYLLGIALIVISLPFSPFFLSLGQFIIAGNWLVELDFKAKWQKAKDKPAIFFFLGIYLIHVVWLINTSNINYALHDLKIKLPLLSLPIIMGTSQEFNIKELKIVLHLFLGAIITSTIISAILYFGDNGIIDNRDISIFISHIRFALMLDMAIFIIAGILVFNKDYIVFHPAFYITTVIWLLIYMVFMAAFSAISIFLITLPFAGYFWIKKQSNIKFRRIGFSTITVLILLSVGYFSFSLWRFLDREEVDQQNLPTHTINGNKYTHYLNNTQYENEHRIWVMVCPEELNNEWSKKSDLDYMGEDLKGQVLRATLIRYLASYGYSKDSVGFSKLSEQDIALVEQGYSNYIYSKKWGIYPRLYELFWEVENYMNFGNPNNHSFSLRFDLARNGARAFKHHPWFGTGTGDIDDEIKLQFKNSQTKLKPQSQFRPHNQYITFLATFGIVGFTLLLVTLICGVKHSKNSLDFLTFTFGTIAFLSMLSEDTLETQAGASFVAFFLSFLLLTRNNTNNTKTK